MAGLINAQQQVATFPIWDGELELWQPKECTQYWPPCEYTARYTFHHPDRSPWTDEMVQELWDAMIQENVTEIEETRREWQEAKEFNDMVDEMEKEVVDYDAPSYFNVWDQSIGLSRLIRDANDQGKQFTPEMLFQQDNLNEMWNKNCQLEDENSAGGQVWGAGPRSVPDTHSRLELVSVGDKFGVAKCEYGSVYVPKSSINHMKNILGGKRPTVGNKFGAWISFAGAKYPWRIETTVGITEVY